MTIADTNILLRLLLPDDSVEFVRASALAKRAERDHEPLIVLEGVLMEALWVMGTLGVSRQDATDAVVSLLDTPSFAAWDDELARRVLDVFGARPALDPVDSLVVARAQVRGDDVASFDSAVNTECGECAVF